jgi:hypothetical protein
VRHPVVELEVSANGSAVPVSTMIRWVPAGSECTWTWGVVPEYPRPHRSSVYGAQLDTIAIADVVPVAVVLTVTSCGVASVNSNTASGCEPGLQLSA